MICSVKFGNTNVHFPMVLNPNPTDWFFGFMGAVEMGFASLSELAVGRVTICVWRNQNSNFEWVEVVELNWPLDFETIELERERLFELCSMYSQPIKNPCGEVPLVDISCGRILPMSGVPCGMNPCAEIVL